MAHYGEDKNGSHYTGSGKLTKAVMKKYKPKVGIDINVNTHGGMGGAMIGSSDKDWRKEECDRLCAEVEAIEKELEGFDATKAGERVKKALEIKLKLKKLRVEEHKIKGDSGVSEY